MTIIFLFILYFIIKFYLEKQKFDKSEYKKETGLSFLKVRQDVGYYGEYQTFLKLEKVGGYSKILANIYIPKKDNTTTEIDLILLHETGIYVFESKNYSGWIFGDEKSKYWTQTFKTGRKERFYNPIWQNNTHIKYLYNFLGNVDRKHYKSIIIFSERCELKKINVNSEVYVINRYNLNKLMKKLISQSGIVLTRDEINDIYNKLKPYTCVSDDVKKEHINNLNAS